MSHLLTKPEGAAYLRISTREFDRLRRAGEIFVKKIGRRVLVEQSELDAYIANLPYAS